MGMLNLPKPTMQLGDTETTLPLAATYRPKLHLLVGLCFGVWSLLSSAITVWLMLNATPIQAVLGALMAVSSMAACGTWSYFAGMRAVAEIVTKHTRHRVVITLDGAR